MNLLLDTHILLWWLGDDPDLPEGMARVIADPASTVVVSAASAWEIAIKKASGRLEAPDDLREVLEENAFGALSITVAHAREAGALPAHHADPFDRMLIAQARLEDLTIATVDRRFPSYDVRLLDLS